jgi:hypothetical protein
MVITSKLFARWIIQLQIPHHLVKRFQSALLKAEVG